MSGYLDRLRRRRTPPPELTDEERDQIVTAAQQWSDELNRPRG